ncbi:hypothetical protein OUZ56_014363 [Daphnia magna]|uniref:Uncharacterized protein n=1 Tax=Daphnia magna TaxID=35525 RepID=A0ABR0AJX8_9CRUS|nr:hypothetical protein OUZ56_014363 [Daphnia magna]
MEEKTRPSVRPVRPAIRPPSGATFQPPPTIYGVYELCRENRKKKKERKKEMFQEIIDLLISP